jgi:hypothetical protein
MNWVRLFLIFCIVCLSSSLFGLYNPSFGSECVNYDTPTKTISVLCGSFNLDKINQELRNSDVLSSNGKQWLLSANLLIDDHAAVFINSTDTDWLQIKETLKKNVMGL